MIQEYRLHVLPRWSYQSRYTLAHAVGILNLKNVFVRLDVIAGFVYFCTRVRFDVSLALPDRRSLLLPLLSLYSSNHTIIQSYNHSMYSSVSFALSRVSPSRRGGGGGAGLSTSFSSASAMATAAAATATATTASLLAAARIGPAAEEARDVRSRVELMAREMSKAGNQHSNIGTPASTSTASIAAAGGNEITDDSRHSIGGISDTDGEGGVATSRLSINRRRKGRGRRPGSESESEGGPGSSSWVYMSKAWALKWATSAYPGPVSNHHVVCRHGRVKPNVGVKR